MAQPMRIKVDSAEYIYNTEAYFLASTIIWTPSQVLVPIDGSDAGKRKAGNNADTYTNLSFEGGGGGGATTSDDVSNESNLVAGATVTDAFDVIGQAIADHENEIAGLGDDLDSEITNRTNADALKANLLQVPTIITVNTAYTPGDRFILNNNTGGHPEYSGPASPADGQAFKFFSFGSDMNFLGNGKNIIAEGVAASSVNIGPDSGFEVIFSTAVDAYLMLSKQGTIA